MKLDKESVEDVAYEVELSEWFDWMRREITQGGIDLPTEETSVLFAARAMQLSSRLRGIYRHIHDSLEHKLVQSAIVFQCWELQKQLRLKSPRRRTCRNLRSVDAVRIVGSIGRTGRHLLVLASDGFQYVITLCSGSCKDTTPATELICNELARIVGLRVPGVAVVTLNAKLAGSAHALWAEWPQRRHPLSPEVCCGFRYLDSTPQSHFGFAAEEVPPSHRTVQHLIGALLFDIWTLNLTPGGSVEAFDTVTGRNESVSVGHRGCLMDANWSAFLASTNDTLASQQGIAARVYQWKQLEPWLRKIQAPDMNPIWELAFQMPPSWYGGRGPVLARVLEKLAERNLNLRQSVHLYFHSGYFMNMKMACQCAPSPAQLEVKSASA